MTQKIVYERHPVSPERKKALRAAGLKIIDAVFAPADYVHPLATDTGDEPVVPLEDSQHPPVNDGLDDLDDLDADALRALAKTRGVSVPGRAGADKLRAILREALAPPNP